MTVLAIERRGRAETEIIPKLMQISGSCFASFDNSVSLALCCALSFLMVRLEKGAQPEIEL